MGAVIKHPVPDRVNWSLVIVDIRALWRRDGTGSATLTRDPTRDASDP